eukprot:scaffold4777_cov258-Pinguiococcus_pyrenoidosus.AAC.8
MPRPRAAEASQPAQKKKFLGVIERRSGGGKVYWEANGYVNSTTKYLGTNLERTRPPAPLGCSGARPRRHTSLARDLQVPSPPRKKPRRPTTTSSLRTSARATLCSVRATRIRALLVFGCPAAGVIRAASPSPL